MAARTLTKAKSSRKSDEEGLRLELSSELANKSREELIEVLAFLRKSQARRKDR